MQHALVENESHACMKDAILAFKKGNPSWDEIRVFMIDKDFSEVSLLRQAFPRATVLLCWFHVKKYLRAEMAKSEYGGRYTYDMEKVEDSVDMMIRADSMASYMKGLRYMYYMLDGHDESGDLPEPVHPLLQYFIKNWDSCKEMWSAYGRAGLAHLGNNTNNRYDKFESLRFYTSSDVAYIRMCYRLEASWGSLKDILKPEMGVDECIETLLFLETAAEMEYASKFNVVGSRLYHDCDEQLSKVAAVVSPHAFQLIRNEYDLLAQNVGAYAAREVQPSIFEVISAKTSSVYHINAKVLSRKDGCVTG